MEVLAINDKPIEEILGRTDALKFRSSMTLFDYICPDYIFSDDLKKYFGGKADELTLKILQGKANENEVLVQGGFIGAIIRDIVGSFFEFYNSKSANIALLTPSTTFTDDHCCSRVAFEWCPIAESNARLGTGIS